MMEIRLHHPEHGWHVVHDLGEVEKLKKIGWDVEKPEVLEPEDDVIEVPKRRGRPKGK